MFYNQSVAIETRLDREGAHSVNVRIAGEVTKLLRCHQEGVINTFDQTHIMKGSGASVTICRMSGLEGSEPASDNPINMKLPRAAVGNGYPQSSVHRHQ